MARKNETGYYIYYDLEYKGHQEDWCYDIPFEKLMSAIRKWFDDKLINIDGTDTSVWNALNDLGRDTIDTIFDDMEDWLKEQCAAEAEEEFREWVDWYYDDEESEED